MSRYTAKSQFPAAVGAPWGVLHEFSEGRSGWLARDLSRSQAEIFAFSLNAIADGHALLAADRELLWGDVGEDHGAVVYVGPTEGVAPQ